jgi:NAD(P)-dependent dehydrogenase (short-subunit alcohol dehydrogenase family)
MGETTAFHLAKTGYHVFAGCFAKESFKKYESLKNVTCIQLDVSDEESVNASAVVVKETIAESKGKISGLYGVLQCAGIAYTAPFEYIPMKSFKRQIDVNYYGYVYVTKAFLPMMKEDVTKPGARRGRFAYVSSGPLPGPGVPFITSYLGAKWAGEALCQGLRMEMRLRQLPIDCVMLSPGIVKPTRLAEEGDKLLEQTFSQMPPAASEEYREMVNAFTKFQMEEPGTHVSEVGNQMELIMQHGAPWLRYFVGYDAQASILVGLLPTGLREHLLRNTLMTHYKGGLPRFFFK